jgi:major membrane immunogen (membrane-anchored lipoprotein)
MAARGIVVALFAAVLLAGCGGDDDTSKQTMNLKFQQLDYEIASMETLNATSTNNLEVATKQYIALVHDYEDELGTKEAQRRLVEKGDELGPYCLPCKTTLYVAAQKY